MSYSNRIMFKLPRSLLVLLVLLLSFLLCIDYRLAPLQKASEEQPDLQGAEQSHLDQLLRLVQRLEANVTRMAENIQQLVKASHANEKLLDVAPPAKLKPEMRAGADLVKKDADDLLVDQVPVYVITPTFPRTTQISEMLRTGQVLKLSRNLFWVIVEDSSENATNTELINMVERLDIPFVYLQAKMPEEYRTSRWPPKGVANRNRGVQWLLDNADSNGVFFFADDDNTYDATLFTEIRKTQRVSVFPIGYIGDYFFDTPVVSNGKVVGFHVAWVGNRKYPVDMAQFAVKVATLKEAQRLTGDVSMPYLVSYEETKFLAKMLVEPNDMEPLADNCTKILVWHTKTYKPKVNVDKMKLDNPKFKGTNIEALREYTMNIFKIFP